MMNFEESLSLLDDSVKDLIISCVEQTEGSRQSGIYKYNFILIKILKYEQDVLVIKL
jgi:hypothetical protein